MSPAEPGTAAGGHPPAPAARGADELGSLLRPLDLGPRRAPNRLLFGPHETNLARRRAVSDRHVAYYRRRAAGGCGTVVCETASVHPSDWPYERAPLAAESAEGWAAAAAACHGEGALFVASLGHAGSQGSSAYHQEALWAPGRVPDVATREVPKAMEPQDVAELVDGFAAATALALDAGADGVEVNAGQHSLLRQFLSGLTNQRDDEWGQDRALLVDQVLRAVAAVARPRGAAVGLRLSCDELAPWAGIVPEAGAEVAARLAPAVDYVTVVRGSIFTAWATRPDGHVPAGFNGDLVAQVAASVRAAAPDTRVVAQGSIVDASMAAALVEGGACDLVEMTRAQIAEPDLGRLLAAGRAGSARPCVLCNQWCQVRDARNPIVSCVVEPAAGHETDEPTLDWVAAALAGSGGRGGAGPVLVVGGGPAGLECARVLGEAGRHVTLLDAGDEPGGALHAAAAAPGHQRLAAFREWLVARCLQAGVDVRRREVADAARVERHEGPVVLCTGSLPGDPAFDRAEGTTVLATGDVLGAAARPDPDAAAPDAPVVVWDPVGGPEGVAVAEHLQAQPGRSGPVTLVTPDMVVGQQLSLTGDLAPANSRLQAAGVNLVRHAVLKSAGGGTARVEDRFSGQVRSIPAAVVVDAGARLPDDRLWRQTGGHHRRAGDAVAPRTLGEAVLEGRRAALAVLGGAPASAPASASAPAAGTAAAASGEAAL